MKILLINNGASLTYFKDKGLELDVSYKISNHVAPLKYLYDGINQFGQKFKLYTPDITSHLENTYKTEDYDFIIWGYNPNDYGSELNSTGGYSYHSRLKGGAFWASVRMDVNSEKYLVHEMHHLICNYINLVFKDIKPKDFMDSTPIIENGVIVWKPYYLNDDISNPLSNHSQTWNNIIPFLPKLNAVQKPIEGKYRYFSEKECYKMTPEFMQFADELRHRLGFALAETSGFRTPEQNKQAGGVPDSAHIYGKAKDWKILDGLKKYQFTEEAQKLAKETGKIIGIGTGDNFMHLDVGHRVQNIMWNYK